MATDTAMATSDSLPPTSFDPSTSTTSKPDRLPVTVNKPTPYTFDLGHLLLHDPNPLPPHPTAHDLSSTARDCAQALINQLLTTCAISSTPTDGVLLTLPSPSFPLPREKPLPPPKEKTKWEKFAAKKGISAAGKKGGKDGTGKMVYDEAKGEWVPKWGYKGKNKEGEGEWIVEVDEKKEKEVVGRGDGSGVRGEGRRERVERVRRNERKERANDRKGRKGGVRALT